MKDEGYTFIEVQGLNILNKEHECWTMNINH